MSELSLSLFASDSINVSSSTPGIIDVWVSSVAYSDQQVGYPVPQGNTLLESSFTVNLIPTGWTVQISTYFDESTSPYGTGQLLATQLFTPQSDSSATFFTPVNAIPAYSLTERYTIFASGSGSVEASAHLLAVLGPTVGGGPFGLIVTALIGLIGLARRKPHATA
jgi:hypothetical protein